MPSRLIQPLTKLTMHLFRHLSRFGTNALRRGGHIFGLSTLLALSTGCASNSQIPEAFAFNTMITPSGLKFFELSLPVPTHTLVLRPTASSSTRRPSRDKDYSSRYIEKLVEKAVENTGYCRAGYFMLGRYAGETTSRVRGECRDKASAADREQFPDTLSAW